MRRTHVPAFFGCLSVSIFLLIGISPPRVQAQATADGSVAVRMIDGIDSSRDGAGKQYHATVTKAVDAGNGVTIPQGAAAIVTLTNSGSGWTTQLVSVTVNGQPVAVSSGPASVTSAAQSAAGAAVSSVNSVLGGFGRRIGTPSAAAAIATGQRVVLPPGTALNFVLNSPPASPAVAAAQTAPVQQAVSAPAPAPAPSANAASATLVAAPGQHWYMCQYVDPKDLNNAAAGSHVYFSYFPTSDSALKALGEVGGMAYSNALEKHFIGYVRQNYKVTDLPGNPSAQYTGRGGGRCNRVQDDAAARANGRDMFLKGARTNNMEPTQVDFADTAAQDAAIDARLSSSPAAPAPAPNPAGNSKECAYHATCSSQAPKL